LVAAILARAMADAQGNCDPCGPVPAARLQHEARAWLADAQAVSTVLELAGYDASVVLKRLRALAPTPGH